MSSLDKINDYVTTVCRQVRRKKAHERITREMQDHLTDCRDAYIAQGMEEDAATQRAIDETGDGTVIGMQLDRVHRPKPQWGMFITTAVLLAISLAIRLFVFNDDTYIGSLSIQLLWMGIGIIGMMLAYFADFTLIGKYPKIVFFSILALCAVLLPVTEIVNGKASNAEYATLFFPLAFSAILFSAGNKGYKGFFQCLLAFLVLAYLTLDVPSLSAFLTFSLVSWVLMMVASCKEWFGITRKKSLLLMLAPVVLLLGAFFLYMNGSPHRWTRFITAWNPYLDPHESGYIGVLIRELLKGSVFIGRGNIPNDLMPALEYQDFFYANLPLATLTSLLGWIAGGVIIAVLLFFIVNGFSRCLKQKSSLGLFVSLSIIMTFAAQVFDSVLYNLGFTFCRPISLPLLSYGNMAMVINPVLIGIMLSVFRTGDAIRDKRTAPGEYPKHGLSVVWTDGKLIIDFRDSTL